MKRFFIAMIPITLFFFGVFALAKSVRFQPWTKPGQEEAYKEFRKIIALPDLELNSESLPKLNCKVTEYDFGTMPPGTEGKYTFTIQNEGVVPIVLKGRGTSCSCLDSDLTAVMIEPNKSHDLRVTWSTDKSGAFAQYLSVTTNCPDNKELQLWVRGNVATILNSSRGGLGFDDLVPGEGRSQDFYLYSQMWDWIDLDRIETSPEIECHVVASPTADELSKIEKMKDPSPSLSARVDLRMTNKARNESGTERGYVRLYVRPPAGALDESEGEAGSEYSLRGMRNSLQHDGTLLIDLPVETTVKRRFSLYGAVITNADKQLVDLGKLTPANSKGKKWIMIARVRGGIEPQDVRVELTGIPNLSTTVEKLAVKSQSGIAGSSYRISIEVTDKMQAAVYDRETRGKLLIETPGIPGEESLEFIVNLDVVPD